MPSPVHHEAEGDTCAGEVLTGVPRDWASSCDELGLLGVPWSWLWRTRYGGGVVEGPPIPRV